MCVFPVQERTALVLRQEVKRGLAPTNKKMLNSTVRCATSVVFLVCIAQWNCCGRDWKGVFFERIYAPSPWGSARPQQTAFKEHEQIGSLFTCSVPQYDVPLALAATWARPYLLL